jgi:hypothetical protein
MVSPLDFIKQFSGQDPSLTKRTAGGAQALADLQKAGAVTEMQQRGATQRSTASDLSKLIGTLAPTGQTPKSVRDTDIMEGIRGTRAALKASQAAKDFRSAGIGVVEPDKIFSPADFWKQAVIGGQTTLSELANQVRTDTGKDVRKSFVRSGTDKPVGTIESRRKETTRSIKQKGRPTPTEDIDAISVPPEEFDDLVAKKIIVRGTIQGVSQYIQYSPDRKTYRRVKRGK